MSGPAFGSTRDGDADSAPGTPSGAASHVRRVLLMHVDAAFCDAAHVFLPPSGFEVRTCATLGEALAEAPLFRPDVLVLAVPLPGIAGAAALEALRALPSTLTTPALVLAPRADETERAMLRACGLCRVLSAPQEPEMLPLSLTEFLDEARSEDDPWQTQLAALHRDFVEQLPAKVGDIRHLWEAWNSLDCDAAERIATGRKLHRQAHSLVGAGTTFGFPEVSAAARRLETLLRPLREQPDADLHGVTSALGELEFITSQAPGQISRVLGAALPRLWRAPQERSVWLLGFDGSVAQTLARFGFAPRSFAEEAALRKSLDEAAPPSAVLAPLDAWHGAPLMVPLLLVGTDDFENRLRAVRRGAAAFCPLPLDAQALAAQLKNVLAPVRRDLVPLRVLVVGETPEIVQLYALLLRQNGLLLRESAPAEALECARDFDPDLFLIEAALASCSAAEFGAVLQSHDVLGDVPRLFLGEAFLTSREVMALSAVGDFVEAPLSPEALLATVTTQAHRFRQWRETRAHDTLTGVLSLSPWQMQLGIEVSRAQRQGNALVLAILELVGLKEINAAHGPAVGDHVLRALSRLLTGRLRRTDVIGRDGSRFLLLLHGAPRAAAQEVLEILARDFVALSFGSGGAEFSATLSCRFAVLSELATAVDGNALLASAEAAPAFTFS